MDKFEGPVSEYIVGDYSKQPLVSILVVTHNSERFNSKFFESIYAQTFKDFEVVFVDNVSSDTTVASVKKLLKKGKILESGGDYGFANGNNILAAHASGRYLFFLNHDAWIDSKCVENLVKKIKKEEKENKYNIYAPKQLTYEGDGFISCGVATDLFGYPARAYTPDGTKQIRKVFYADGAAFFLSKETYLKVGMMDARHYLYAEDTDLTWKVHMAGGKLVQVPDSVVYHFGGGSIGIGGMPKEKKYKTTYAKRFLAERNIINNILKNYYWWNIFWVLPYYILINVFEMIAMVLTGQIGSIWNVYIRAYIWNIQNIKSTLKKRNEIQNIRKVGDFAVMRNMYFFPSKYWALLELGVPKVNSK